VCVYVCVCVEGLIRYRELKPLNKTYLSWSYSANQSAYIDSVRYSIRTVRTHTLHTRRAHRVHTRCTHRVHTRCTHRVHTRYTHRVHTRYTHTVHTRYTHRVHTRCTHRVHTPVCVVRILYLTETGILTVHTQRRYTCSTRTSYTRL